MPKTAKTLTKIVDRLEKLYAAQSPLTVTDPLGMIMLENVAYLVSDERRAQAFSALRERVGLTPPKILMAPENID
jgi:hypothetical protein